jgi:hypothetical protein
MVGLHRTVLGGHRRALDQGQQVALEESLALVTPQEEEK